MKASTLRVALERPGVAASFSRLRVSNDTPVPEALRARLAPDALLEADR